MKDYPKQLKIVFKQQPLPFHKDARPAAKASLAAHKQGKFWEYHDVLFENMKKLKQDDLEGYAKGLKLNMKKFKKDMADASLEEQVKRDQALAAKIGARGTPTSFVNGYMVRGAQPVAAFKKIIDRELAKAKAPKAKKK
jgi:protein-disulfide isomerase